MNDSKAKQQEIVELRKESRLISKEITEKNNKIKQLHEKCNELDQVILQKQEEITSQVAKAKEIEESLKQREEKLNKDKESWESSKKLREQQRKQEEKNLFRLNSSNINAKSELERLESEIEQAKRILVEIESKQSKVVELEKLILTLSEAVTLKSREFADIEASITLAVATSNRAVEKNRVEVEYFKEEKAKLRIELHELSTQIVKQKHDIAIYISRAQVVYQRAFPELQMKL